MWTATSLCLKSSPVAREASGKYHNQNLTNHNMNSELVSNIIWTKKQVGPEAYLWARITGDVVLWENKEKSQLEDGSDDWQFKQSLVFWSVDYKDMIALRDAGVLDLLS